MKRFEDQICLVTAATTGIGFAIAERFLKEGAFVHICSRKKENVEEAVSSLKQQGLSSIHGHVCDVANTGQRTQMLDVIKDMHDGRLDILVANAGMHNCFGDQLDITEKRYQTQFDINVKSTFFLIKECKDMLLKSVEMSTAAKPRNPNILVNTSMVGRVPDPRLGVYSMTKAALDNMVVFMAQELMEDGIRVNGIAPGLIQTDMTQMIWTTES